MSRKVWIVQCLCPQRHCIIAAAGETDNGEDAVRAAEIPFRETVTGMIKIETLNPWCGLCHARSDTWTYEGRLLQAKSLAEARPILERLEREQAAVRAMWGDMARSD